MAYVSADERRRQLVEAAIRVLQRDGVRGLTTRKVAEEADAPLASIHYAFGSKEDLVEAAIRRIIDDMTASFLAEVDTSRGLAVAVRSMVDSYWRAVLDDQLPDLVFADMFVPGDESSKRFARTEYDRYRALTQELLERAVATDVTPPAVPVEQLARLLVLCADGVLVQYTLDGEADRAEADLRAVAEALIRLATPVGASSASPAGRPAARSRARRP